MKYMLNYTINGNTINKYYDSLEQAYNKSTMLDETYSNTQWCIKPIKKYTNTKVNFKANSRKGYEK